MVETIQQERTLSLGFIGVGWIGRNRMEVLARSGKATVKSIFEPGGENAADALRSAPGATLAEEPDNIYDDADIDGVVIATPSAMHAKQAIAALNAGKHVFCQKPLGRNASEVRDVVAASKKANRLLEVDLSYRHTKAFQELFRVISSGEIGNVYAVDLVFHNAYGPDKPWFYDIAKSGGGCVMDLGIHLIDLAMICLGFPEVGSINSNLYSKGTRLEPAAAQVEDFASVQMTTVSGTTINLQCSWHVSAGRDAVIEATFYGTSGGVALKNVDGSFYDFTAEKYLGTQSETLVSPPDDWSGKAGIHWAARVIEGAGFDAALSDQLVRCAELIDRIYGRQA